ncbi:CAP domain-containing protein [Breoghania sp.]|uniref:CAP domain-containing protein n=1 Tax=Breoghania sp. TaxID=2065378 RepID=UPI0029CA15CD|nr:CAP domain-containing protein [Breoghania sp.]
MMISGRHLALAVGVFLLLGGCAEQVSETPPFYVDLGRRGVSVDEASARTMISTYREKHGAPGLTLDPALTQVAEEQAREMAAAQSVDVSLAKGKAARQRLDASGYPKGPVVANVSAGYRRLAEAFSGWRDSPQHNANMLDKRMTRMGIATAYAPGSKYKVFWSLVLAGPEE